jgi:hypothetical protein
MMVLIGMMKIIDNMQMIIMKKIKNIPLRPFARTFRSILKWFLILSGVFFWIMFFLSFFFIFSASETLTERLFFSLCFSLIIIVDKFFRFLSLISEVLCLC